MPKKRKEKAGKEKENSEEEIQSELQKTSEISPPEIAVQKEEDTSKVASPYGGKIEDVKEEMAKVSTSEDLHSKEKSIQKIIPKDEEKIVDKKSKFFLKSFYIFLLIFST